MARCALARPMIYLNGTGAAKDEMLAVQWYTRAAEQGYARAQCNLGVCYEYGTGVVKDAQLAVQWYTRAAEQGFAHAQYNLGVIYLNGTGVAKDEMLAVQWYTRAAEQGFAQGQCNLGLCYHNGTGVAKDEKLAVQWYTRAAEQGYDEGQCNLGMCYHNGTGVVKDAQLAVYWLTRAAEQGDKPSRPYWSRQPKRNADLSSSPHPHPHPHRRLSYAAAALWWALISRWSWRCRPAPALRICGPPFSPTWCGVHIGNAPAADVALASDGDYYVHEHALTATLRRSDWTHDVQREVLQCLLREFPEDQFPYWFLDDLPNPPAGISCAAINALLKEAQGF